MQLINQRLHERKHAERTESDLDWPDNDALKARTLGALKMKKNLKKTSV